MLLTPEEKAAALVTASAEAHGGPWFVRFGVAGRRARIGPYENPDHAKGDAEEIRKLVAEAIREARGEAGTAP